MLIDGRTNVHNEERSGGQSVMSDGFIQSVDPKKNMKDSFIISSLSCEFPQMSRTVLYEIIAGRLAYHKFCSRWVP
jgi:hypothetical protein